ncbi:hypothetical protein WH8501_22460 [Crocosphaera watsonii WH 8501]|uniref:tRNA (Guanine37-N1)-methyltransferase n=6 Tax=Crocosphaera TaxID=263510 RepID=T2JRI8_CROWT|nr:MULTISPECIES: hypothetical protein [Crocosphaera]EHJ11837.1 hypothetical protein CWATWH0003_3437 [Crocosphaera watsonii WH 0003]MCH2244224.1 hypothetical protein [Crocosphaera sp.]CCQ50717.1 hypothetical protein CWATWH8502_1985 [Crocosphaera watsonii WH 8502]CCQ58520.1 hypothetical protein CWATWH0005_5123 [Crocosphaera watsonii WH 0005]CCQ60960.1 tRNA (Guanine37-N1)-methyltransferase [Crocosphaera watsonii WH 0401]
MSAYLQPLQLSLCFLPIPTAMIHGLKFVAAHRFDQWVREIMGLICSVV